MTTKVIAEVSFGGVSVKVAPGAGNAVEPLASCNSACQVYRPFVQCLRLGNPAAVKSSVDAQLHVIVFLFTIYVTALIVIVVVPKAGVPSRI